MQPASAAAVIIVQSPKDLPWELVSKYLNDCRDQLPALSSAVETLDYECARLFGHKLKGTGAPYGFRPLTQFGAAIEIAASGRNALGLQNQVSQLADYLSRVELAS